MNIIGLSTLLTKELRRTWDVLFQAILSPVITTTLYFVVFGGAIGSQIHTIGTLSYAAFIVPGLIIMALIPNALSASSSGIYFPKFTGSITDLLTAPLAYYEIAAGFALAAMTRATIIGAIIYVIAWLFTDISIAHPFLALLLALTIALAFACFGLVVGLWANDFERLAFIPTLVLTPLSFLGGVFYDITMLPPLWQKITLANPIYYMVDGLRWCFFDIANTTPMLSFAFTGTLLLLSIAILAWMFHTGYKIKP